MRIGSQRFEIDISQDAFHFLQHLFQDFANLSRSTTPNEHTENRLVIGALWCPKTTAQPPKIATILTTLRILCLLFDGRKKTVPLAPQGGYLVSVRSESRCLLERLAGTIVVACLERPGSYTICEIDLCLNLLEQHFECSHNVRRIVLDHRITVLSSAEQRASAADRSPKLHACASCSFAPRMLPRWLPWRKATRLHNELVGGGGVVLCLQRKRL